MNQTENQPIGLAALLQQCGAGGEDNPVTLPQSWTQGRTAFGGLSTALAYQAASHIEDSLPGLRSAQIAFTGPLFGQLTAKTAMLQGQFTHREMAVVGRLRRQHAHVLGAKLQGEGHQKRPAVYQLTSRA